MIRNLFSGATKCRTIDKLDIFSDGSCKALYRLDGNANDESGNYHGTETNVTYGGGVYERGAVFNGSGYINTILPPSLFALSTSWSASLWVNSSVIDANTNTLLSNFSGLTPNYKGFQLSVEPTKISYGYMETSTAVLGNYTITIATNTWYHIVVSVVNGVTSLYIDGTFRQSHTPTSPINPVNNMAIGVQARDLTAAKHRGSIDQVRIFNRAITATEVATLYAECEPTSIVDNINPFEDGSLKALYKFDNDATDATGVYNGTPTNVTYGSGRFGRCAVFNGSSSKVVASTSVDINVANDFAVSVWIKPSSLSGTQCIYDIRQKVLFLFTSVFALGYVATSGGVITYLPVSTSILTVGLWSHIVLVKANGVLTAYHNGNPLIYSQTSGGVATYTTSTYIGAKSDNTSFFNGSIDQLRIFNKALTPLEVASLYNETTPMEELMSVQVDPFKDGSGKALYRLEGNALDESRNYNGTPTNVTYGSGRFGRCAVFNGSTSQITSSYSSSSNSVQSFSFWFKANASSFSNLLGCSDNSTYGGIIVQWYSNKLQILTSNSSNQVWNSLVTTSTLAINTWYHAVLVLTGSAISVYINGVLDGSISSLSASASLRSMWVGYGGGGACFNGTIDQIRVFNKALTQTEVTALYNEI